MPPPRRIILDSGPVRDHPVAILPARGGPQRARIPQITIFSGIALLAGARIGLRPVAGQHAERRARR